MTGMHKRAILLTVAVAIVIGTLACSSSLVSRREDATATPTKTLKPTFTATLTPTETPIPTDTPTPTNTVLPTDTPAPTNTPVVFTATPSPAPTDTPTATDTPRPPTRTPTRTRRPATRTPTPRPPTATPTPSLQWAGQLIWDPNVAPNCNGPEVSSLSIIKERSGTAINDAEVLLDCYGNQWISRKSGPTGGYQAGHYDFSLSAGLPQNWTCTIKMYRYNDQMVTSSQVVTIQFDTGPCEPGGAGHQVAIVNWTKNY